MRCLPVRPYAEGFTLFNLRWDTCAAWCGHHCRRTGEAQCQALSPASQGSDIHGHYFWRGLAAPAVESRLTARSCQFSAECFVIWQLVRWSCSPRVSKPTLRSGCSGLALGSVLFLMSSISSSSYLRPGEEGSSGGRHTVTNPTLPWSHAALSNGTHYQRQYS
jgi:hypothetical protein